jgi:glycosyltransferase involved in cell wall biosynthesis
MESSHRMIELLHPPWHSPSGGNVYNRALVAAACARGLQLSSVVVDPLQARARWNEKSARFRIWDSYFLPALDADDFATGSRWGLLLHYLPSHDPMIDNSERLRLAAIERRALRAAALVIVTSRETETALRAHHPGAPIRVCEPGLSPPFTAPPRERAHRSGSEVELLTVANLIPAKGVLELLNVLAELRGLPWRWHLIGNADINPHYTRRFDDTARALGLAARIRRHGMLDQVAIAELMDRADLFVFSSRFEAYGMALAEAAARALPAVTTAVGAAERIYQHGLTGLLSHPEDTVRFAMHLKRLVTDARLRGRFRESLRVFEPRVWEDTLNDFIAATSGCDGSCAS